MDRNSLEYLAMLRLLDSVAVKCPEKKIPDDYMVLDTETTGVNAYADLVLQFGICWVTDRKKGISMSHLLSRPGLKIPKQAAAVHHITEERLEKEGVDPKAIIPILVDILRDWQKRGLMFVGHNLMAFDVPLFEREAHSLGVDFKFDGNKVLDTGMLVKAAQLGMFMRDSETLRDFWLRVSEVRAKGIKWSLAGHCYTAYNLGKYGLPLEKAHDAEADCQLSHFLLEELRLLAAKEKMDGVR
jgi:DNA polymerase III epsilon subunit-like protein